MTSIRVATTRSFGVLSSDRLLGVSDQKAAVSGPSFGGSSPDPKLPRNSLPNTTRQHPSPSGFLGLGQNQIAEICKISIITITITVTVAVTARIALTILIAITLTVTSTVLATTIILVILFLFFSFLVLQPLSSQVLEFTPRSAHRCEPQRRWRQAFEDIK